MNHLPRATPLLPGELEEIVARNEGNNDVHELAKEILRLEDHTRILRMDFRAFTTLSVEEGPKAFRGRRGRFREYGEDDERLSTAGLVSLAFVLTAGMILLFALSAFCCAQDWLRATWGFAGGLVAGFGRLK